MPVPLECRVEDAQSTLPVEKVEFRAEQRPGEVAPSDDNLGENSPNLLPIATMVDWLGAVICLSPLRW
jgi:hypothetical protein